MRRVGPGKTYDDYKTRLGNLTMLEKPINIVAGNGFFTDKKLEYVKSGNYLTRSIVARHLGLSRQYPAALGHDPFTFVRKIIRNVEQFIGLRT
jgi:hypothetical protein